MSNTTDGKPHRKRRRSINEPGHAHFLTYSCYNRLPLLGKDRSRQWVIDAMHRMRIQLDVSISAFVIMPEHVHMLVIPRKPNYEMRRILAALKAPVSRQAKSYLIEAQQIDWVNRLQVAHGNRTTFRFWQVGGGYDKNLWNGRPILEIIDYIHANPVRRGLVKRPTDWKWSSARAHAGFADIPLKIDPVLVE